MASLDQSSLCYVCRSLMCNSSHLFTCRDIARRMHWRWRSLRSGSSSYLDRQILFCHAPQVVERHATPLEPAARGAQVFQDVRPSVRLQLRLAEPQVNRRFVRKVLVSIGIVADVQTLRPPATEGTKRRQARKLAKGCAPTAARLWSAGPLAMLLLAHGNLQDAVTKCGGVAHSGGLTRFSDDGIGSSWYLDGASAKEKTTPQTGGGHGLLRNRWPRVARSKTERGS